MKKFITSLICFIALLLFEPIAIGAPTDVGYTNKKDVLSVSFVKGNTFQKTSQHLKFNLDIPPDTGKIYSNKINIDNKKQERFQTQNTIMADFKVGWNLKGSQLTKYITKNTSIIYHNNISAEKAKYAITNADFKVGWQNYLKEIYKEKTPGAVSIGKYQEKV